MRTANVQLHNAMKALLSGAALLSCVFFPQAAQAEITGLYPDYTAYAYANGWVTYKTNVTMVGTNPVTTIELVWKSGYETTDDTDGDGLVNGDEFNGWRTVINGRPGWFTGNATLLGAEHQYGFGSNPQRFDSDCDGMSDWMEFNALTDPRSADTDSDTLKDPVEIFAGLNPRDDGFIYDNSGASPVKMTNIITGQAMKTLWHPDMDIDGDGLTTKQELKKANDLSFGATCPKLGEIRAHFPSVELLAVRWTNPFDCDTDSDWLLDSFERAWSGFNPVEAEADVTTYHRHTDADRD